MLEQAELATRNNFQVETIRELLGEEGREDVEKGLKVSIGGIAFPAETATSVLEKMTDFEGKLRVLPARIEIYRVQQDKPGIVNIEHMEPFISVGTNPEMELKERLSKWRDEAPESIKKHQGRVLKEGYSPDEYYYAISFTEDRVFHKK